MICSEGEYKAFHFLIFFVCFLGRFLHVKMYYYRAVTIKTYDIGPFF